MYKIKTIEKSIEGYLVYFHDCDMVAHVTDENEIKELEKQMKSKKPKKRKK